MSPVRFRPPTATEVAAVDAARRPAACYPAAPSMMPAEARVAAGSVALAVDGAGLPMASGSVALAVDGAGSPMASGSVAAVDDSGLAVASGGVAMPRLPITAGVGRVGTTHGLPRPARTGRSPPAEPFPPENDR